MIFYTILLIYQFPIKFMFNQKRKGETELQGILEETNWKLPHILK